MPIDPTETTTSYRATAPRWFLAALALGATPEEGSGRDGNGYSVCIGDRNLSTVGSTYDGYAFFTFRAPHGSRVPVSQAMATRTWHRGDPASWMRALSWLVTGDDRVLADPRAPHLTHTGE